VKHEILLSVPCFTLLLCLVAVTAWTQSDSEWELKKEKDGIKVYLRKNTESGINEVLIRFEAQAPLEKAISILRNPDNYKSWVKNCEESRQMKMSPDGECLYYSRIHFPWPISDRDIVVSSRLFRMEKDKQVVIQSTGLPDHIPETPKVVRIAKLASRWTLTEKSDGNLFLENHLISDPGGSLPSWLINLAVDKGPMESAAALRKQLESPMPSSTYPVASSGGD